MNATTDLTRCPCGHDQTHPAVRPAKRYGWLGQMALIMGYTARPARIDWVCSICGTTLGSVTDPATMERFRYDEPRREHLHPPATEDEF